MLSLVFFLHKVPVQNLEASTSPPEPGTTDPTAQVPGWLTVVTMEQMAQSPVRAVENGLRNPDAQVTTFSIFVGQSFQQILVADFYSTDTPVLSRKYGLFIFRRTSNTLTDVCCSTKIFNHIY